MHIGTLAVFPVFAACSVVVVLASHLNPVTKRAPGVKPPGVLLIIVTDAGCFGVLLIIETAESMPFIAEIFAVYRRDICCLSQRDLLFIAEGSAVYRRVK
ncbi:MAG: hypothetical protein LBR77_07780 [Lachnospiraceae bacterium]|jgi:hypothetical protein|nr:hypothetical protein [Lachnospiraceae bacterium]